MSDQDPGGSNWISKTHLAAVGFYEFASVSAAMSAALALLRGGARRAAAVCAAGALLSLLLFSAAPVELGLMQRAWLLVHSAPADVCALSRASGTRWA